MGGLIVHYIPSLLVITLPPGDVYSFILDVEGYPGQVFALAVSVGLVRLNGGAQIQPYEVGLSWFLGQCRE